MRRTLIALVLGTGVCSPVAAEIYRCQNDAGQVVFSDAACADNAQTIEVHPVTTGGRLDTGTDVETWQPEPASQRSGRDDGCDQGYIQSTRLRTLRARRQVSTGMSAEQVRYILGDPDRRDGHWWIYTHRGEETGRYRMKDGCLASWR
ncbi:DUF4124 domain-containing protein [Marinobacter bohaiensis]|uniref:DUF4124 domain-containing protein n=1 Tax=Marinobacter bohaiensis TaxID=2201898 RepID=UPI000DAC4CCC|nr:DUF4124 domain-containing protein [Marinobacter bohaiensis]